MKLVVQLNPIWRVVDDPLQWILQRRTESGWRDRRFHAEREALIELSIRHLCGAVDPEAISVLKRLPAFHPDQRRSSKSSAAPDFSGPGNADCARFQPAGIAESGTPSTTPAPANHTAAAGWERGETTPATESPVRTPDVVEAQS